MASYNKVKGLSIITLQEGKKIGVVDDLLVDPDRGRVRWLRVQGQDTRLFGGQSRWVPIEAVHAVGDNAVTIDSEAHVYGQMEDPNRDLGPEAAEQHGDVQTG